MAKEKKLEWYGADVVEQEERKTTQAYMDSYTGVDADVPRTRTGDDGRLKTVMVRKPAPAHLQVKTTARNHDIGKLTARYKLMREGFRFAPLDDKAMWETRKDIAFEEMQAARFAEALALEETKEPRNDLQVNHLKRVVAEHRGMLASLLESE